MLLFLRRAIFHVTAGFLHGLPKAVHLKLQLGKLGRPFLSDLKLDEFVPLFTLDAERPRHAKMK